jgi:hypothetical protein
MSLVLLFTTEECLLQSSCFYHELFMMIAVSLPLIMFHALFLDACQHQLNRPLCPRLDLEIRWTMHTGWVTPYDYND